MPPGGPRSRGRPARAVSGKIPFFEKCVMLSVRSILREARHSLTAIPKVFILR